jgi:hypothetical protein
VLGCEVVLLSFTEVSITRTSARAYEATECRFTKVAQLESWVHCEILGWSVRADSRIVGNEDVVGLDVHMDNFWPCWRCSRIALIGEPLFHHQISFDERFEDVPEGWFLNVTGIVLILMVQSNVVLHQS